MCRAYKRHVKTAGVYLPFTPELRFRTDQRAYKQKQGTNVCGYCVCDFMFHCTNDSTFDEHKIEVS
jgi:hypothetical protein